MKPTLKYLFALAVIVILCGFKYSNRECNTIYGQEQMETLHYHGHTYICYKFYDSAMNKAAGGASIVHDPDCKCGKGGGK
ncbi:MAG: hypothetical protein K2K81_07335 [Muribaculaceae bacterium]|nr:hypothetical protein [Muribaculaceae bacterium]